MIGYILLVLLLIVSFVMMVICDKHCWDDGFHLCMYFAVAFFVFLLFSTGYLATRESEGEKFMEQRECCQELLNYISDDISFDTIERLVNEAKRINARIETNKRYAYSDMWGFMYNKRIAEVEPIKIPVAEYRMYRFKENNE